ncbi:MAG: DivIVA domain-containing protein [Micrococcales bacterium]
MPNQFPNVSGSKFGYEPSQVDAFITMARDQYDHPEGYLLAADQIRETEFDLIKGGYEVDKVDAALDRIEDALADRELTRKREQRGNFAISDQLERVTELVRGRIERPKGQRFSRVAWPSRGYSRKQVDKLCNLILEHLVNHEELIMAEVRRTVFTAQRGGYAENQVDAFIDRVIQILHIERNS